MNVFRVIRRSLWGALLAALLLVGCVYLALAATLLSASSLTAISHQAGLATTIRNDMILPHLIAVAQQSDYAHLLDKKTITTAFNAAVPQATLEDRLAPAITATRDWLDSKQPDISFTIDTTDISQHFTTNLSKAVADNIKQLPACNYENSLADAEYGVCQSPYISAKELTKAVHEAIDAQPQLQLSSITADDINVSTATRQATKNLPDYINILYAASLLTAGLALLVALWLLSKHHLSGLITIGGALVALAIVLYVGSLFIVSLPDYMPQTDVLQPLTKAASGSLQQQLQREAISIGGLGLLGILVFGGLKLLLNKHRSKKPSR